MEAGRAGERLLPPHAMCSPQTPPSPCCPQGDGLEAECFPLMAGTCLREGSCPPPPLEPLTVPSTLGFSSPQISLALVAQRSSGSAPSPSLIPEAQITTH